MVRFAVGLPNVGEFGDPGVLVELGVAAEEHGWDGVFLWDHLLYHDRSWPVANSVVVLSAVAARTRRVRLGVLMTALPRRRVQNVAKETATLDVLSGGRLVVGAGLGSMDAEYAEFGEDPDLRARAAKLDRGLEELTRLWRRLPPAPVQPRIPIWCPGRWPTKAACGARPAGTARCRRSTTSGGSGRCRSRSSPAWSASWPPNGAPWTASTSPWRAAPPTAWSADTLPPA
ncbi:LLM class flavin-dependent oxidoreductase [Thermocatellispora tengchongensis]|uniref:LLM class flavin-dependent oxidoreductase n=1 Tax=Thermocatellispora tengchongensis TaxID=1073253 RepID=UPI00362F8891